MRYVSALTSIHRLLLAWPILAAALVLGLATPAAAQPTCSLLQLTDTTTGISFNASANTDGSRVAFTSTGQPVPGGNPEGNTEVFLWDRATGITQITSTGVGAENFAPNLNAVGDRFVFISSADLVPGGNVDGNREIFLWDSVGGFTQITSTTGANLTAEPDIDAAGNRLVFTTQADLVGGNADGNAEIFLFEVGVGFTQITTTTAPSDSRVPAISGDGTRVAFASSADLVPASNADGNTELFLWDGGVFSQLTATVDPFTNVNPAANGDGSRVVFQRGLTLPGNAELWVWDQMSGLVQLTNALDGSSGPSSISSSGDRIAFDFDGDPLPPGNADGNGEVFFIDSLATFTQITTTTGFAGNGAPSLSADGQRAAFLSSLDLTGGNADGNQEIFLADCAAASTLEIPALSTVGLGLLIGLLGLGALAVLHRYR